MPDRIEVHGAGKPGTDFIEVPTAREQQVEALLAERRGYAEARANGDELRHGVNVKAILGAIDEQLRALGGDVPEDAPRTIVGEGGPELVSTASGIAGRRRGVTA